MKFALLCTLQNLPPRFANIPHQGKCLSFWTILRDYVEAILALPAMQEWIKAAEAEPETIPSFNP